LIIRIDGVCNGVLIDGDAVFGSGIGIAVDVGPTAAAAPSKAVFFRKSRRPTAEFFLTM